MQRLKIKKPDKIKEQIYSYLNSSKESKFIHRLHGILLLIEDKNNNCASIGKLFNNSPRSLSNWVHKINTTQNIEELIDKKQTGRKTRLNSEQEEFLKECIKKHPIESGLESNLWDGKTLSYFIEKQFNITLKVRQCQRLFNKLGFVQKRGRSILAKGNSEAKKNLKKT